MFLTQVYGTILGGFVNYAVMISIVDNNRALLTEGNGDSSWSGATLQAYNTNATAWALAKYLYKTGATYAMVPIGLAIGAGAVAAHRIFVHVSATYLLRCWYFISSLPVLPADSVSSTSSSPKSEASRSTRSICPSSFNTPAISRTTRLRPALSSARLSPAFTSNSTYETTARASSRTTRTWSPALLTVLALRHSSFYPLPSSARVVHLFRFLHGGATRPMVTSISALLRPSRIIIPVSFVFSRRCGRDGRPALERVERQIRRLVSRAVHTIFGVCLNMSSPISFASLVADLKPDVFLE